MDRLERILNQAEDPPAAFVDQCRQGMESHVMWLLGMNLNNNLHFFTAPQVESEERFRVDVSVNYSSSKANGERTDCENCSSLFELCSDGESLI